MSIILKTLIMHETNLLPPLTRWKVSFIAVLLGMLVSLPALAGAIRSGFDANDLPANDDGSSSATNIGFSVNFFGTTFNQLYVNNNGNITFEARLFAYTPLPLISAGIKIIAPFWADVDTRGTGLVRYGPGL
jgi:hypothetical protein